MLCKALKTFVSVQNMKKGETRELTPELAKALSKGGFVEIIGGEDEDATEPEPVDVVIENNEEPDEVKEPEAEPKAKPAKRGRPSAKK